MPVALQFLLSLTPLAAAAEPAAEGGGTGTAFGLAVIVLACIVLTATKRPWGVVVTAAAGAAVALYTVYEHHAALAGLGTTCKINDVWSCGDVLTSKAGEAFGLPIGLFGFAFYAAMTVLGWRNAQGSAPHASGMILAGSIVAVGVDAYLGSVMLTLGKGCVLCVTTYALNLTLLGGALLIAREKGVVETLKASLPADTGTAVIVGLAALIAGVLWQQSLGAGGGTTTPAPVADPFAAVSAHPGNYYERTKGPVELDGTEPLYGDINAKYTLVEWADYQCPHCARMFPFLHEFIQKNPDFKLYYKHYPLSSTCNRFMNRPMHPQACAASLAAECARQQGRFWEVSEKFFANQEYLGDEDLLFMAGQVGLDKESIKTCMQKPETAQSLAIDVDAAGKLEIDGTPSIFIQGLVGDGWVKFAGGPEELETLVKAARTGKPLPPAPAPAPPPM